MAELEPLPDPLIESPVETRGDMTEHTRTYDRFVRMVFWFIFHIPFLLIGIYVMTLGGQPIGGAFLVAVGIAVLIFGSARALAY